MENWGSDGIWRVGDTTLWYVDGVAGGDSKIVAPDISVKMDRMQERAGGVTDGR